MSKDGRMPNASTGALPKHFYKWQPRRQQKYMGQVPSKQTDQLTASAAFPSQPSAPPSFLPMTPAYEAAQRGASDQLAAAQTAYTNGLNMIQPQVDLATARLGTDKTYATNQLNESMADRGLWDSSVRPYLSTRDIAIPYGRQEQDIGNWASQQAADLASQWGAANLGYNQSLAEALLNRAAQVAQEMPLSLPQYGYSIPATTYNRNRTKPKKTKPKKNGRK